MVVTPSGELPLGWEAENFSLKDTDETQVGLENFKDKKGLLVVFSCNHCPYARAAWPLTIDLYHRYGKDIGFVAINPNDEIQYPDDSFEQMKVKKKEWEIPFPYLRDETQEVAKAYQARCTPDPYLLKNENGKFTLFYRGRINDNWQSPELVEEKSLEDAIERLVRGGAPSKNQPPSMGCSIKWQQ